jgi:hypothetical protein
VDYSLVKDENVKNSGAPFANDSGIIGVISIPDEVIDNVSRPSSNIELGDSEFYNHVK